MATRSSKATISRTNEGPLLTVRRGTRPVAFRDASGEELDAARIAEVLTAARDGQVAAEVTFDARVYRQREGEPLTPGWPEDIGVQHVLFRPGSMRTIARSGSGTPFLQGHEWGDVEEGLGGTVEASSLVVDGDGDGAPVHTIAQSIRAEQPWAIAGVLSGAVRCFSIGFMPGPVWCSAHKAAIFARCACWPGDPIVDGDGAQVGVVQWLIQSAALVESSAVNVPAVGNGATGVDAVMLRSLADDDLVRDVAGKIDPGGRLKLGAATWSAAAGLWLLAEQSGAPAAAVRDALEQRGVGWQDGARLARERGASRVGLAPGAGSAYDGDQQPPNARGDLMDPKQLRTLLALPADATDDQVRAKLAALRSTEVEHETLLRTTEAQRAATEQQRAADTARRVDAGIATLRSINAIPTVRDAAGAVQPTDAEARFRSYAGEFGVDAFEAHVARLREITPAQPASQATRSVEPPVIDTARAAATAATATATAARAAGDSGTVAPFAAELAANNPEVPRMLRVAGIRQADVEAHGPRAVLVLGNLAELAQGDGGGGIRRGAGQG